MSTTLIIMDRNFLEPLYSLRLQFTLLPEWMRSSALMNIIFKRGKYNFTFWLSRYTFFVSSHPLALTDFGSLRYRWSFGYSSYNKISCGKIGYMRYSMISIFMDELLNNVWEAHSIPKGITYTKTTHGGRNKKCVNTAPWIPMKTSEELIILYIYFSGVFTFGERNMTLKSNFSATSTISFWLRKALDPLQEIRMSLGLNDLNNEYWKIDILLPSSKALLNIFLTSVIVYLFWVSVGFLDT